MLCDVVNVKVLDGYKLQLQFDDGKKGEIDISKLIPFRGIFEKLKNKDFFSKVFVNVELGTICWENGADIAPELLYNEIQSKHNHG